MEYENEAAGDEEQAVIFNISNLNNITKAIQCHC